MKIIVDVMGGDNAPVAMVSGALMAAKEFGYELVLVGRGEEILKAMEAQGVSTLPKGVEIYNAAEVVDMCDNPTSVLKDYPDSSMVVGLKLLAADGGDAFVSAGNTGALLTAATLTVKRIKGIRRAALAPVIPSTTGGAVLIDCGANAECNSEYLTQFAFMGSFYAKKVLGVSNPRIGLLNNGTEPTKGAELQKETYQILDAAGKSGKLNFVGNVEARGVPNGEVDVVVADGFTGNVLLKAVEGVAIFMSAQLKGIFYKNAITKLAGLLVKSGIKGLKQKMDYQETGGTMLLGIAKPVIKAHGSCGDYAFRSAIRQAAEAARSGICQEITENIDDIKAAVQ